MEECLGAIETATLVRHTNPVDGTHDRIQDALRVANCCREGGRVDLAVDLLDKVELCKLGKSEPIQCRVKEQRTLIEQQSTVLLSKPIEQHVPEELPPLIVRGWNFAFAMFHWAKSGFKMCTQEQIEKRLAICQECPYLDRNNHCTLCGCACQPENQILNKLALCSSECPIAKWGKIE